MAKSVTHMSKIAEYRNFTVTGTMCNRMACGDDINCTTVEAEVTCKLCIRQLSYKKRKG